MMLDRLRALARRARADVVCECRHCGTTVASGTDTCPECDVDDITQYRIP